MLRLRACRFAAARADDLKLVDGDARFALQDAADAYALMASGKCGKVAVCADEELAVK